MSRLPILVIPSLLCLLVHAAAAGERIEMTSNDEASQLTHVSIQLDAGGHNLVRPQQDDKAANAEQKLPISVAAKLAYDEKRIATDPVNAEPGAPLAVRYYDQAEAVIKVNETGRSPRLTDDRR